MNAEFDDVLQRISATLGQSGEVIPFRRGLRRHIGDLAFLRYNGLTWDQIARMLATRGVKHKRGQIVNSHQLRTVYAFLVKQNPSNGADVNDVDAHASTTKSLIDINTISLHRPPGPSSKLVEILSTRTKRMNFDE